MIRFCSDCPPPTFCPFRSNAQQWQGYILNFSLPFTASPSPKQRSKDKRACNILRIVYVNVAITTHNTIACKLSYFVVCSFQRCNNNPQYLASPSPKQRSGGKPVQIYDNSNSVVCMHIYIYMCIYIYICIDTYIYI